MMAFYILQLCIILQVIFISQCSAQDCKDNWNQCANYAGLGYCEANPNFKVWCRLSCKVCTPDTAACQDTASNCDSILTISNICARNEAVRKMCAQSCNACSTKRPEWGQWSGYSSCSVTCGKGTMTRTRTCSVDGKCSGSSSSSRRCTRRSCKKKPSKWSSWGKLSPCSVTCGIGTRKRVRVCKGKSCKGSNEDVRRCTRPKCKSKEPSWGKWSTFGPCSVTCGRGTKTRKRVCIGGASCTGSSQNTNRCYMGRCPSKTTQSPPSNGWSRCTKTCGTGTQFKFDSNTCRSQTNPKCFRTFRECNTASCPKATCYGNTELRYGQDHSCCQLPAVGQRVLLGEKAKKYQWPWMVFLLTSRMELCGGTLIHERWVMTAGHCVTRNNVPMKASEIQVYVGILRLQDRSNDNKYLVEEVLLNNYRSLRDDIALLKLTNAVKTTLSSKPIDLPQGEVTPVDSICYATGWGLTSPNPPILRPSDPLMEVDLQILDLNVCQKAYNGDPAIADYVLNSNKLICAGSLTKMNDVCRGDSGGPLVCQRCSSCDWYIAGITSFGPKGTCGKQGTPGMFTKVAAFETWIRSNIPGLSTRKHSCS